ncbi:MAG: hypothetical protein OET90_11280, partial [Desulfuromonadales bacterium]|nr:hypothetical protein [Desulfuromonadales bacterium]
SVFHSEQSIKRLCLRGYISALLGTGNYHKAEELANFSAIDSLRANYGRTSESDEGFDFQYLFADLDHLLCRYEFSRESVRQLLKNAKNIECTIREGRALWLDAHLTGHIGDNLENALSSYSACIHNAKLCGDELLILRSHNGQLSLRLAIGDLESISEDGIKSLIAKAESLEGNRPICSALYRNLARFLKLKNDFAGALSAINQATAIANEGRLRTTINCDYGKGEIARFKGQYDVAVEYYRRVIEATIENGVIQALFLLLAFAIY